MTLQDVVPRFLTLRNTRILVIWIAMTFPMLCTLVFVELPYSCVGEEEASVEASSMDRSLEVVSLQLESVVDFVLQHPPVSI